MARLRLSAVQQRAAQAIVNVFETGRVTGDYGRVAVTANDAGHLTYGRAQTTLTSGGLALLVRAYCDADGAYATELMTYLPALEAADLALDTDRKLHGVLRRAGLDPAMQRVQDAFVDRVYWQPAVCAAEMAGLRYPLSVAVIYDSTVHGSYQRIRRRIVRTVGTADAVGEKRWVRAYVDARRRWLGSHANPLLRRTVYRMDAFKELMRTRRWTLRLPLTVRGAVVNRATLDWPAEPPVVASAADMSERVLRLSTPRMRGDAVRRLQRALGFAGGAVDGIFGPRTDLAVRLFQEKTGLKIDGCAGPATWARLGSVGR
jgi:chitosanase